MNKISIIIIPFFILFVVIYGYLKKVDIYSSFLKGAFDGLKIVYNIFPTILAMVFAVNIFFDSGFLFWLLSPINKMFDFASEIFPMALLRPISGTASLSIMTNIFIRYGPDSYSGLLASVLQGCTDTTIYVIALYYSSIKVSKTRYTVMVGLIADLVGILMAFFITNIFF